jgi:membrane protein
MLRSQMDDVMREVNRWWLRLDPWTRALPGYLWRGLDNFNRYGLGRAAALAYYAIFSIFPLTLLLAVAIGGILGPAAAGEQVRRGLELFVPGQTVDLFQSNVNTVLEQGRSFGLIAVAGLIWSGLGLFTSITNALDLIFAVPASRSVLHQRLVAFGMALTLIVLILTSFLTSAVLRLVSAFLLDRPSSWILIGTIFLPLGINMVIFALLFRYVPAKRVHWDAVWPAAIFGAVGWELLKSGFSWYTSSLANFQIVYGSIATVIVFLFWAYLIASIFLLSAELCAQLNEWLTEQEKQAEEERYLESKPLGELPLETGQD